MPWYTASIIVSCRLKSGAQDTYPVYEKFILIDACDKTVAEAKARAYAASYEEETEGITLNGADAYWKFEGIRKITTVTHLDSETYEVSEILDGSEVSYSYMEVSNVNGVNKLAKGAAVTVKYIDMDE